MPLIGYVYEREVDSIRYPIFTDQKTIWYEKHDQAIDLDLSPEEVVSRGEKLIHLRLWNYSFDYRETGN